MKGEKLTLSQNVDGWEEAQLDLSLVQPDIMIPRDYEVLESVMAGIPN